MVREVDSDIHTANGSLEKTKTENVSISQLTVSPSEAR